MRKNISLKSTMRQPVRTAVLLLLLAAAVFGCLSQVLQYAVLQNAARDIGGYYRAIGSLYSDSPDTEYNISGCMDELEQSPYVEFIDHRRMASYTAEDVLNADIYSDSYAFQNVYLCGEPENVKINYAPDQHRALFNGAVSGWRPGDPYDCAENKDGPYRLSFRIKGPEAVAGFPDYLPKTDYEEFFLYGTPEELEPYVQLLNGEKRIFFRAQYYTHRGPHAERQYIWMPLYDGSGDYLYSLAEGQLPDLSDPALEPVKSDIELMNVNMRTSMLWSTKDMTAIPNLAESYVLSEGRLLNYEDQVNRNPVCVIRQELAEIRDLEIGDTMTITVRNLKWAFAHCIRPDLEPEPWEEAETHTETLTIVGLLTCTDPALEYPHCYSEIYVPDWVVPQSFHKTTGEDMVVADYTNFVLHSVEDIPAFTRESEAVFTAEGYNLRFEDTNWDSFAETVIPMKQSALTSAGLFGIVLVMTMLLAIVLYLFFRRKELPILRSLGVRRSAVFWQTFRPMALVSAVSMALGGAISYQYGMEKAMEALSGLETEFALQPRFTPWNMTIFVIAVWGLFLVLLTAGLLLVTGKPVLEQLQGTPHRKTENTGVKAETAPSPIEKTADKIHAAAGPLKASYRENYTWKPCWIIRSLIRCPFRTVLMLAVPVAFLLGLGWLQSSISQGERDIDRLYDTVQVTGQILRKENSSSLEEVGYLPVSLGDQMEAKGVLTELKREIGANVTCVFDPLMYSEYSGLPAARRPKRTTAQDLILWSPEQIQDFEPLQTGALVITYRSPIYNDEAFFQNKTGQPEVVVSERLLGQLGCQVGQHIDVTFNDMSYGIFSCEIVGTFPNHEDGVFFDVLLSYDLLRGFYEAQRDMGMKLYYARYDFATDIAKNRELSQFREMAEALLKDPDLPAPLLLLLWDSELTQAVEPLERNLGLLRLLYPVMQLLAVFLTLTIAALQLLQSRRELAILRVLGVRGRQAVGLLTLETLLVGILGVLLGLVLSALLGLFPGDAAGNGALYLLGCLTGAGACAVHSVRRNPIDLLQVRE